MARAIPIEQMLRDQLQEPEFRAEWERTAFARGVALWLVAYRAEHGRVEVDGWGGSWIRVFHGGPVKYPVIPGTPQAPMDNFIDAVLGRAEPQTSPTNGVIQSQLMDAIYESARTGQAVKVS